MTFKAAMYYTFNMIVLGIDPGYAIIGFGLIDTSKNNKVIDYGVITTPKEDSIAIRLKNIESALCSLFEAYHPDAVAVEELFYFKNQKTVIPVAEARGVILLTAQKFCENIFEYTPMQIKQALTGQGRAEKKQIQFMVKSILGLKEVPKPDDAADALAAGTFTAVELAEALLDGDMAEARRIHHRLSPLFRNCFIESNPIPVKSAMALMGLIENELRLPLVPASEHTEAVLKATLKELDLN